MTRGHHLGSPAGDTSTVQAVGPRSYDEVCDAIAADLAALGADHTTSLPRLMVDLLPQIENARAAGHGFAAIATVFTHHSVPATSDAVRVALGRERKRRNKEQSTRKQPERRQATLPSPPTVQPVKVDDGTRADTSAADPQSVRETPPTPPRVGVGRHLD